MRQLLPELRDDVDPLRAHAGDDRPPVGTRPWVLVNMVVSVDGATAVEGRSGGLSGPADKAVFRGLRALADVVLVAAGTARADRYHAPKLADELIEDRRGRGQSDLPRLAIVSRRLDVDEILDRFPPEAERPIVITTADAPDERRQELAPRADLVTCGHGLVDLREALAQLRERWGAGVVVAEGGPTLNAALMDADLLDELCTTFAPLLAGGESPRLVHGALATSAPLDLARALEQDGFVFLRHVRRRD